MKWRMDGIDTRTLWLSGWSLMAVVLLAGAQEFLDLLLPFFLGLLAVWSLPTLILTFTDFRKSKLAVTVGTLIILLYLWIAIPFSPQQRFFRSIRSIHAGMTVEEVEGQLHVFVSCRHYLWKIEKRPLASDITGPVSYTHNDPLCGGIYTTDGGAVTFKNGKVVKAEWQYD